MKISTQPANGFAPFKLIITIEAVAELASLWARFNLNSHAIWEKHRGEERSEEFLRMIRTGDVSDSIWEKLEERFSLTGVKYRVGSAS